MCSFAPTTGAAKDLVETDTASESGATVDYDQKTSSSTACAEKMQKKRKRKKEHGSNTSATRLHQVGDAPVVEALAVLQIWLTPIDDMATPITRFWRGSATPELSRSDNFFLASLSINPTRDPSAIIEPDEFKLQCNHYIRCCTLAKPTKHTKRRKSVVWLYGEDIQLKRDGREKFWYCYLCEKQHKQQELPIIGKGNTTALDHLEAKHNINRATGELKPLKQASKDADQLSIADCNNMKSLIFARRLDHFKELLVLWIVCCHIALFQIENAYFRDMLFYLFPPLGNLLLKAVDTIRR